MRFFFDESMPGRRCVVQDCGNIKNDELGISIHNSPASGSVMLKWKSFVSMHRKNFNPVGQFAVCVTILSRVSLSRISRVTSQVWTCAVC